jgi:phosphoribosylformylglycinamidine cyclo-ligase
MKSVSDRYREAGVDINAGYRAVELMRSSVERTRIPGVLSGIGGFGGLFAPDLIGMKRPVLVSGTDGVGTKLQLAFQMDKHDTVGIDCVAMCVNDVLCCGATPLFFLDYIAVGHNVPAQVADIVAGMAEGCVQAGCALIGGETAEMPGFYPGGEYDIAGFCVGLVDEEKMIDTSRVRAGDVLIALPSSGVHSNGFSLVRKALDTEHRDLHACPPELGGLSLGETLLTPTRIYVKPMLKLFGQVAVKGVAHITGGGFFENIPRSLPKGFGAFVETAAIRTPPIFGMIARKGEIPRHEMFATFNMGVGLCVTVDKNEADLALRILREADEAAYILGDVRTGSEPLTLC